MSVWRLGARAAWQRPVIFSLGWVAWVGWWASPIAAGLLLRALFDAVSGQAPVGRNVATLALLFLGVESVRAGVLFGMLRLWARWWISVETLMRVNLLESQVASGGPRATSAAVDSGVAVTVFRDDVDDFVHWVDTWLDVSGTLLFAVAAVIVMVRIDAVVTVAVVGPIAAAFLFNRLLTRRIRAYRRADREATERVTGFLGQLFSSVLAVKVAGAETHAVGRLANLNNDRRRTALRDRLLTDSLEAANSSSVDVAIGLVLLLAAGAMRAGTFTVGDLALFTTYLGWLAALPRWIGFLLTRHRHAQVAAGRMGVLQPPADRDGFAARRPLDLEGGGAPVQRAHQPGAQPAAVTVRALRYTYPDGSPGVDGIDLDLLPGSLTVVTGPVGAGKTTLLRALLGLIGPVEGEVRWNGQEVDDLARHCVPPRSAYVGQVPRLFTETLHDNLTLGVAVDDDALAAALWAAVLDTDVADMPEGLETVVGSRGVRLSGGQAQRAATARALVTLPELLVVDDLSSALDVATERALWDRLLRDRRSTILAVSHRPATLARADQVISMQAGRVTQSRRR
jgi:ATP-binding cassette, subfamily B, bacterial